MRSEVELLNQQQRSSQLILIENFYKSFFAWQRESTMIWFGAGFCVFLAFIVFCTPYQAFVEEGDFGFMWVGIFSASMADFLYIKPYLYFREHQKQKKLVEKLRFLPVEQKVLIDFGIQKMIRFALYMFLFYFAGQLLFSSLGFGGLVLGNLLCPFLGGVVLPLLFNVVIIKYCGNLKYTGIID